MQITRIDSRTGNIWVSEHPKASYEPDSEALKGFEGVSD